MANNENLKPIRTEKEARQKGQNGGKKSGEARRAKKTMKQMLDYLLEKEITNKNGEKATTLEAIMVQAIKQSLNGNIRALEFIRDTIGQNPRYSADLNITSMESTREAFLKHLKEL